MQNALQSAWLELLPQLLHGASVPTAVDHIALLDSCSALLSLVVSSTAALRGNLWQFVQPPRETASSGTASGSSMLGALYVLLFLGDSNAHLAEQLAAAMLPPLFGSEPSLTEAAIQGAFTAAVELLHSETIIRRLASLTEEDKRAALQRALHFLQLFRTSRPEVVDTWWAAYGATIHELVSYAQQNGSAALKQAQLQLIVRVLCCQSTAEMLALYVMGHPAYAEAKDGPRRAFSVLAALLQHDIPAFLEGCCATLQPENSCSLAVRIEGLQAMNKACDGYLRDTAGDREAAVALWTPSSLQSLLFALNRDPSIRIRREAMRLLTSVSAQVGSPQEEQLLHAVSLRCRDKDELVRCQAYQMLVQFPAATLHACLSEATWFGLLNFGLTVKCENALTAQRPATGRPPTKAGMGGGKHGSDIHAAAQQLLGLYLFSERCEGAGLGGRAQEGDGGEQGAGGGDVPAGWLERLEVLGRHSRAHGATGFVLVEQAYESALQGLLQAETLLQAAGAGLG
ncbi:hypothetical protein N2152v2_010089 [Parachlorella kessleri]